MESCEADFMYICTLYVEMTVFLHFLTKCTNIKRFKGLKVLKPCPVCTLEFIHVYLGIQVYTKNLI